MSHKADVFLVQMPQACPEPNMALAQLYAYMKKEGFQTRVMDISIALYHRRKAVSANLWADETWSIWMDEAFVSRFLAEDKEWMEERCLKEILSAPNPVVGFSVSGPSLRSSQVLARWIKDIRPDALIVMGGQVFAVEPFFYRQAMEDACVDAVILGDGEETLAELAALYGEGRDWGSCRGLYVRDPKGGFRFMGERPLLDLDSLPFADYSAFDMSLYGSNHVSGHDLVLMTSRGCVRRCSFCGNRTAWKGFRQMSGERVYAEIEHQRRAMPSLSHPDSEIKFYDLLINGDMKKMGKMAELLAEGPEPPLPWKDANAVVRPEMTFDICSRLYQAGCRILIIGMESGSQKVLDAMDKGQTVSQMKEVLKNAHRAGLKVRANFMFGHPGETDEDFGRTMDFLKEMHPYIYQAYPSYTFTHLEGRLAQNPEKWGVRKNQHYLYWESDDGSNTFPKRLERYKAFRELAVSLGKLPMGDGLVLSLNAYTHFNFGGYYENLGQPREALDHYWEYLREDPSNAFVKEKILKLSRALAAVGAA
ncbi:MAG TPA: radical SAM protein [Elusimicrobiota bacterium]|nr:radical SAM protein [Elusimicrobiota bacterium]